jgi:hypothetical protein
MIVSLFQEYPYLVQENNFIFQKKNYSLRFQWLSNFYLCFHRFFTISLYNSRIFFQLEIQPKDILGIKNLILPFWMKSH